MSKKIPSTRMLLAFEAVSRHSSFTKAAVELALTDSAVSYRVRDLECMLNLALFERHTRSVELTVDGHRYLNIVRAVLKQLHGAFPDSLNRPSVRISVLPSFARFWLIPRLKTFNQRDSKVILEIDSTTRLARLDRDECDIAIRFCEDVENDLSSRKLMDDRWLAVIHPDLVPEDKKNSVNEIFSTTTLLVHARQSWSPWFEAAGVKQPKSPNSIVFTDTALIIEASLDRQGVALVRWSLVKDLVQDGKLKVIDNIYFESHSSYFLMISEKASQFSHIRATYEWIHNLAKQN
jgi:LysR family glycine cleavage system transcriptional activator